MFGMDHQHNGHRCQTLFLYYVKYFVAISLVVIFVDHGRVYVVHVCFDLLVVNGVGSCVDICGVVCSVVM